MKNLFNKFKKIILVFMAILMFSLSLAPSAKAAVTTSWYNQSFEDWFVRVYTGNDSEIFGERYTAAQVQWILYSFQAQLIRIMVFGNMDVATCIVGKDLESCMGGVKNVMKDLITSNNQNGSIFAMVTSSPMSGIGYISNLINKFSIVPEARAQEGFGFTAASPVLAVWKISRDISFGFLVLVVIIFAFMIMFRVKINPQTVISVQSALPKVVIAIILITFSYAIAGLLIDLMYVLLTLFVAIVTNSGLFRYSFTEMISFILGRNIFEIYIGYWAGFMWAALSTIASKNAVLGIFLSLFAIIAFFILLYQSIKGIFALLKNFAMIIITIITGPLEILVGTLSSSGGGFGGWISKLISYLAVYPVITAIILFAHWFLAQGMPSGIAVEYATSLPFDPKVIIENNTWNVPFTVWEINGARVLWIVVSFVLICLIPKVFDIIKSFMERKPFEYGSGIGQVSNYLSTTGQVSQQLLDTKLLSGLYTSKTHKTGLNLFGRALRDASFLGYIPRSK